MSEQPEFFWAPPDGASIVGVTKFRNVVVVATSSGVYTIGPDGAPDEWTVRKISDQIAREPSVRKGMAG
ncbi:hypothetical protein IP86_03130 [Rhodopseudomonas sp. AAP120]|nr:hypothetical protein IP86_03130 [Rhodopseudomonas sp. AAP120]